MNRLILACAAALAVVAAVPAEARQESRVVVTFEPDSDVVTAEGRTRITAFARQFRTVTGKSVKIEGHATLAESEANSPGYAVGLAQRRANNVRSALFEEGVEPGVMTTASFGAGRPIADVPAASARNRRVEISIADGSGW